MSIYVVHGNRNKPKNVHGNRNACVELTEKWENNEVELKCVLGVFN
jgi:hypothetical protein